MKKLDIISTNTLLALFSPDFIQFSILFKVLVHPSFVVLIWKGIGIWKFSFELQFYLKFELQDSGE